MSDNPRVRRATVEDVPQLIALWKLEELPCEDLERRFREFQVVESEGGELLGAIGIQIAGHEGWLHSEVITHPEHSDLLREHLWQRLQTVTANHGVIRLWTRLEAPFWHAAGFVSASAEELASRPAAFAGEHPPDRFLQLREEAPTVVVEKELALFREAGRRRVDELKGKARFFKTLALLLGVAIFVLALIMLVTFLRTRGVPGPR